MHGLVLLVFLSEKSFQQASVTLACGFHRHNSMLTIFFGICIYGMAERELRRGWLWGPAYCLGSALVQTTLIAGYWGAVLSLLLAIAAMTWANMKYPIKKGPFLR